MKIIKKTTLVLILLPLFLVGVFGQWISSAAKVLGERLGIVKIQAQSGCWTAPPPATTATTGTTDGTTCTTNTTGTCCGI